MLKLVAPRQGRSSNWTIRGTHLGVSVLDRSTKTRDRATARLVLRKLKAEIERGCFSASPEATFVSAAGVYMAATGQERFIRPLVEHFGFTPLNDIDQQALDHAAIALYPKATPATRNRQVYSVVSAILKHADIKIVLRRPKGSRGSKRTDWLTPPQAFALFRAADERDAELGIFVRVLLYTGMRLSEALGLRLDRLDLSGAFAYVPTTKSGAPRGVHLPPVIVAALASHPRGLDRPGERVFRFRKCGWLYTQLRAALDAAGIVLPPRSAFHVMRHTWATWMRRYGGLDTRGLVGTGAWADLASAARYEHVVATEEARRADLLPIEETWNSRGNAEPRRLSA